MGKTTAQDIISAYPQSAYIAQDIVRVSNNLDIDPSWLANVIKSESNFDYQIQNKDTLATGLIQFIPSTARGLGTTTQELLNMTPSEQMNYVEKYLKTYKKYLKDQNSVVLAVFYPAALVHNDDWDMAGDWATRKGYQKGTQAWEDKVAYFSRINGGIRYKGDYYKKFLPSWRLEPKKSGFFAITQRSQTALSLVPNWVWYISMPTILVGGWFLYKKIRKK